MKPYLSILLILAVIICEGCSYFENDRIFYAANDSCTLYLKKWSCAWNCKKYDSAEFYRSMHSYYLDSMRKVYARSYKETVHIVPEPEEVKKEQPNCNCK